MTKQRFLNWASLGLIVTVAILAICLPHKPKNLIVEMDSFDLTENQKTARIDIANNGTLDNAVSVFDVSDKSAKIITPEWFKNDKGQGTVISSQAGKLDFSMRAIKDGNLSISLRGVDLRDKQDSSRRIPVCVKYLSLTVNGKTVLTNEKVVWHDSPYIWKGQVKNSETLKVHVEWIPFTGE